MIAEDAGELGNERLRNRKKEKKDEKKKLENFFRTFKN